ncbi:DUF6965 family protein [Fibrivirga algicola]|uniref:DUF6965 domain-containing protein n=1 Tax=Fibrivirga algicola TaxID=2950420 RepID=A0ABX0QAQ6_9BACT|nr:hypothetical protein [Fibrivirga algicola]NID09354.1 hypothetical protein [Fibrivirga algicola]
MNTDELIAYFEGRQLPTGKIRFSSFESTDDAANMVRLNIARIKAKGQGADTAAAVLTRLRTYLDSL